MCVALGLIASARVLAWASPDDQIDPLEIGLSEHLGDTVAGELRFVAENGDTVALRDTIDRPTLVSLVYYTCPSICRPLLDEVAEMLSKLQAVDMQPGRDYRVLTISFDETDSPDGSARLKDEYYRTLPNGFPREAWTFLTADSATIAAFTQSVGFGFRRAEKDFAHPTTLIVLSPEGKITRYLTGSEYLPLDIKLALIEAREGKIGATIVKFYKFCFSYDPSGEKFVLKTTRIVGLSTLVGLAGIVLFVSASGRRREMKVH
ncbi:MAG: SCO family protein [Candidatus Latescibacteria bacterium]|nr:SCO family protein [Candidatus Latescibacterota bacterium]